MPQLSEDTRTILNDLKKSGHQAGDTVLIGELASLLGGEVTRAHSALDELIKLGWAIGTPNGTSFALTRAGAGYKKSD
jgi:hypothetical protein